MAVRAVRGGTGPVAIRGGERTFELSLVAAITFFLDVGVSYASRGRLAQAVAAAESLEAANDALRASGCGPSSTWSGRRPARPRARSSSSRSATSSASSVL